MRRSLTILAFISLLLSAWDAIAPTKAAVASWNRLRSRQRPAPDTGWDRFYGGLAPLLPPARPLGLVQSAPAGTPVHERQYYFLQYALAPRLVMPGPDADEVVVYGPASAASSLIDLSRYAAVQSFEDEFTLYRRSGR